MIKVFFYCEDCGKIFTENQVNENEDSFATCPLCKEEEIPCITKGEAMTIIKRKNRIEWKKIAKDFKEREPEKEEAKK